MMTAIHRTAHCHRISLIIILLIAMLVVAPGCNSGKEREVVRYDTPATDGDKLLLLHRLPLGADYREVKSCFPRSGPMTPSTAASSTEDSELVTSVRIMEHDATLRFAFQKHMLLSYAFDMSMLDSATASDLNSKLQEFYTKAFGNYHESVEADRDVSTWSEGGTEIQVINRKVGDGFQLFWEFRKPRQPRRTV